MSIGGEIVIVLLLVSANAVLAAAEIAILSVRKTRLQELAAEGSKRASAVLRLRSDPESFLATIQVGITIVSATAAAFGGATIARALSARLAQAGAERHAEDLALGLVVGGISFLSIVFGELVPKSLALRAAERLSLFLAWPVLALSIASRPLVAFLTASSNLILSPFDDRTTFTEARLSKEELQQLVDEAATTGALDAGAGEIAYRALDFGNVRVAAVMVPRSDVVTLSVEASRLEIRALVATQLHSRIPIHGEAPDDVLGYVTIRDLVSFLLESDGRTLVELMREAQFVPESRLAVDVMRDMQRSRDHLALVIDEAGVVSGLVTIEDIVEELVGEIFAEHETPLERMHHEPDGSILVRGRVPVHEVNRDLGIALPEDPAFTTIAGLTTALAGAIPRVGLTLHAGGVEIEVTEATDRRVVAVRLRLSRSRHV
jgi:putative hemolysin